MGQSILFVCMGNICRSPTAEGIFIKQLQSSAFNKHISTDSGGTHGYHIDHPPDSRAIATAAENEVDIGQLRSRKVRLSDFEEFDLIIAMDNNNLENLKAMQPDGSRAQLKLMLDYLPETAAAQHGIREVPDPYYGDSRDFEHMYELLEPACAGLLESIEKQFSETLKRADQAKPGQ
jgi:protein-tyrosine phosphatase